MFRVVCKSSSPRKSVKLPTGVMYAMSKYGVRAFARASGLSPVSVWRASKRRTTTLEYLAQYERAADLLNIPHLPTPATRRYKMARPKEFRRALALIGEVLLHSPAVDAVTGDYPLARAYREYLAARQKLSREYIIACRKEEGNE